MNVTPAEFLGVGLDQSHNILKRLYIVINDLVFSPPYDMFKQIFLHCVSSHKRWTIDLLKEHLVNPEKFQVYIDTLSEFKTRSDPELIIEKFYSYKLLQITDNFVQRLSNYSIWTNEVEETVKTFSTSLTRLIQNKSDNAEPVNGLDLLHTSFEENDTNALPLRLGFDDQIQGGIHPGEVLIYMAPTNGGKTSTMIRQAAIAAALDFKVFYASLEMGLDVIKQRLEAAIKALNVKESIAQNLFLKQYPSKRVTIDEIFLDVDAVNCDVVILDYLDLLKIVRSDQIWLDLEETIAYFRGLLVERRQVGITASQANREGMKDSGKTILDLDKIAGSVGKAFTADYVITINPPSENSTITHFYLAKNRRGPKWLQSCNYNLETLELSPLILDYTPDST